MTNDIKRQTRTYRRHLISFGLLSVLAFGVACARTGVSPASIRLFLDGYCSLATRYTESAIEAQDILREVRSVDRLPADLAQRIDSHLLRRAVVTEDLQILRTAEADLRLAVAAAEGDIQ